MGCGPALCILHPYYSSPNRYPTHSTTVSFLILEFYCNFSFFTFILVLRSVCGGESGVTEIWDDVDLHLGAEVHLANMHKSQMHDHQLEKKHIHRELGQRYWKPTHIISSSIPPPLPLSVCHKNTDGDISETEIRGWQNDQIFGAFSEIFVGDISETKRVGIKMTGFSVAFHFFWKSALFFKLRKTHIFFDNILEMRRFMRDPMHCYGVKTTVFQCRFRFFENLRNRQQIQKQKLAISNQRFTWVTLPQHKVKQARSAAS